MTRGLLVEQIYRIYSAFKPTADLNLEKGDIRPLVDEVVNTLIKAEAFLNAEKLGWNQADGLALATYHDITVEQVNGVTRALLPIMPVSLIRNTGVWQVSPDRKMDTQYIPMQSGQYALLKPVSEMWMIKNLTTYEVFGRELVFNKSLSTNKVSVRLIIKETTSLSDYDVLPIPADKVGQVMEEVLKILGVNRGAVGDMAADNRDENG